MEICIVRIILEKLGLRQNSKYCNADFWQVRKIGLPWNFKMLQWINLNESFRPYYTPISIKVAPVNHVS